MSKVPAYHDISRDIQATPVKLIAFYIVFILLNTTAMYLVLSKYGVTQLPQKLNNLKTLQENYVTEKEEITHLQQLSASVDEARKYSEVLADMKVENTNLQEYLVDIVRISSKSQFLLKRFTNLKSYDEDVKIVETDLSGALFKLPDLISGVEALKHVTTIDKVSFSTLKNNNINVTLVLSLRSTGNLTPKDDTIDLEFLKSQKPAYE